MENLGLGKSTVDAITKDIVAKCKEEEDVVSIESQQRLLISVAKTLDSSSKPTSNGSTVATHTIT